LSKGEKGLFCISVTDVSVFERASIRFASLFGEPCLLGVTGKLVLSPCFDGDAAGKESESLG
jgi:hypothetical protein